MKIIRYFLPRRRRVDRLILPPRGASSVASQYGTPPDHHHHEIRMIKAAGIARTDSDAWRKWRASGMVFQDFVRANSRKRRKQGIIAYALKKLRQMLWVVGLAFILVPGVAHAQGPMVTVTAAQVNVRSGPGIQHQVIGVLRRGARLIPTARTDSWILFSYWGRDAYISASPALVSVRGQIPAISAPAQTSGSPIELVEYQVVPTIPAPGQGFKLVLTLKNSSQREILGFNAAVAFELSGHFAQTRIQGLAGGQSITVDLQNPGETKTGKYSVRVVIDLNNELGAGEMAQVKYTVDRPYITQSRLLVNEGSNVDLNGGKPDLEFGGGGLRAAPGAKIMALPGKWGDYHFDALEVVASEVIEAESGTVFAILTSEGRRGLVEITSASPGQIELKYVVYR